MAIDAVRTDAFPGLVFMARCAFDIRMSAQESKGGAAMVEGYIAPILR